MKWNKNLIFYIFLIVSVLTIGGSCYKLLSTFPDLVLSQNLNASLPSFYSSNPEYSEVDQFRKLVITFVREVAEKYFDGKSANYPKELETEGGWEVQIIVYFNGEISGDGKGKDETIALALEKAVKSALKDERYGKLTKEELKETRFLVNFLAPQKTPFSFIEYNGRGKELAEKTVAVRELDKELIRQKIEQGKEYLFRVIDEKENGVHKYYYAQNDSFENRLHTIYTSTLTYTLLKIYEFEKNDLLLEQIFKCGEFILSMQNKQERTKGYGAFYYSYYLDSKEREKKFPVGTTAKTIFTLLKLYELTGDSKYLESAELGADWLITMQKPDGSMKSYIRYTDDGKWVGSTNESLLYNGQVLSAFSRIYNATKKEKYYIAAKNIAENFSQKIEKEGCYLGDDYRTKNPISSSWAVMSLLDFYKISRDYNPPTASSHSSLRSEWAPEYYKDMVFRCSDELFGRQMNNTDDVFYSGRWQEAYSTSGNGWICEVMAEVHEFCRQEGRGDCDKYKEGIIRVIRWLIQNTYSDENSFMLKNPERANGGLYWSEEDRYVRTDSVCHGLNGYIGIINYLENRVLLSIPKSP